MIRSKGRGWPGPGECVGAAKRKRERVREEDEKAEERSEASETEWSEIFV